MDFVGDKASMDSFESSIARFSLSPSCKYPIIGVCTKVLNHFSVFPHTPVDNPFVVVANHLASTGSSSTTDKSVTSSAVPPLFCTLRKMCCPTKSSSAGYPKAPITSKSPANPKMESSWSLQCLPALLVVSVIPLLPTWCYINRGFTQWFHWVAVLYFLTRWDVLERFQVITGISICLGWYSALGYAAVYYGQFFLVLYQNMPSAMKDSIFHPETGEIHYESSAAKRMMLLSHTLDFLGHPLLTYFFWRRHKQRGGTAADIFLSWPVIVSSYFYSRLWSMTHCLYNTSQPGYFYIGHDVYVMQHLDCWVPAYVMESVFFASVVL